MMLSFQTITGSVPQTVLCVLFTLTSIVVSQLALSVFQKWSVKYKIEFHNEVAGIVFGGISLIYSLILAFVIVAVWDDYKDLERTIEAEADKLNNILSQTDGLPDSIKTIVTQSVYNYCDGVINNEWQMNNKKKPVEKPNTVRTLRQQLLTTNTESKIQQNVLAVMDTDLSTLSDLRRERLNHSHSQIPAMVWFILDAGSVITVLFFFFLKVPSLKLKRIYLAFLVSCITMCMFLVYTLDHPFNDEHGINTELYQEIQTQLKSPDNGST